MKKLILTIKWALEDQNSRTGMSRAMHDDTLRYLDGAETRGDEPASSIVNYEMSKVQEERLTSRRVLKR